MASAPSNDNVVGSAAVEVYGDIRRLEADLRNGEKVVRRWDDKVSSSNTAGQKFTATYNRAAEAVRKLGLNSSYWLKSQETQTKAIQMYERSLSKASVSLKKMEKDQQEAARASDQAAKSFKDSAEGTKEMSAFSKLASEGMKRLAALVTVGAIIKLGEDALQNATAIKQQAEAVNVSVEELQRWHYIAQQTGVDAGDMDRAMEQLDKSMGRASLGAKRESQVFKTLQISLTDTNGKAKSVAQVMPEVADALNRIEDTTKRAAVAQLLFGESADEILPALKGGSAEINNLSDAADRLGIVLSTDEIANLDKTNQKLEDMKTILSAKISREVAENADSIIQLTDAVIELVDQLNNASTALSNFLDHHIPNDVFGLGEMLGISDQARARNQIQQHGQVRIDLDQAARDTAVRDAPKGTPLNVNNLLKPAGRAKRDPHRERAYENELAQLQTELLRGLSSQTKNASEKAIIEAKILDIEKDRFQRTLAIDVKNKKFTKAEADQLSSKFAELDAQKRAMLDIQKREQVRKDQLELETTQLQDDAEILSLQKDFARSNKERREIELDMLDIQYEIRRKALEAQRDSETSSDLDKKLAEEKLAYLEQWKDLQDRLIRQDTQGPVAQFFQSLRISSNELQDRLEQVRVNELQDRIGRSVQMADDLSGAFGNVARDALALRSPLQILTNFLTSFTNTFNEEVLIRPLQEWTRQHIGGPLAEKVTGAPSGPEGLWIKQLGTSSFQASTQIDAMALAATRFAQGMNVNVAGGGGGGGLLGTIASIAGVGAGFTPSAGLVADVSNTIAANPGIFDEGGMVGPGGMPVRRKPSNVGITAEVGEYLIPPGPTKKFRSELDMIRMGKTPNFAGMGGNQRGGDVHVQMGDMIFPNVTDERTARQSVRQAASDLGGRVARAAKTGLNRNDR